MGLEVFDKGGADPCEQKLWKNSGDSVHYCHRAFLTVRVTFYLFGFYLFYFYFGSFFSASRFANIGVEFPQPSHLLYGRTLLNGSSTLST